MQYAGQDLAIGVMKEDLRKISAPEAFLNRADTFAAPIKGILGKVDMVYTKYQLDASLSNSGKLIRITEALARSWNEMEAYISGELRPLDEIITGFQNKIRVAPYTGGNVVADMLIDQEVRVLLRPLIMDSEGIHKIRKLYLDRCKDGTDPQLIRAIEQAPQSFPILTPDDIVQGRQIRAKSENPDAMRQLELYQTLRDGFNYIIYHSKNMLINSGFNVAQYDWGTVKFTEGNGACTVTPLNYRQLNSPRLHEAVQSETVIKAKQQGKPLAV